MYVELTLKLVGHGPTYRPTDLQTYRPTDIVTYRAAIAAKKEKITNPGDPAFKKLGPANGKLNPIPVGPFYTNEPVGGGLISPP